MINDIFYNRYEFRIFYGDSLKHEYQQFFTQVAIMLFEELVTRCKISENIFKNAHLKLAKELGAVRLNNFKNHDEACGRFLLEKYDLWNDSHGTADDYLKLRLSLIELIYRELEDSFIEEGESEISSFLNALKVKSSQSEEYKLAVKESIKELNLRFANADMPLHYHNGYIQFSKGDVITKEIEEPFWTMLQGNKWRNIDLDLKESINKRDNNERDAALYACKGLESTLKIISDDLGLTSGRERGAANYIDNLVSKSNGRIIDVWEADMLKLIFSQIRNPHGHGPGNNEMPKLTKEQETWVIESSMSWIKSLIKRNR